MRYAHKIVVALFIIAILAVMGLSTVADAQSYSVTRPGGRGGSWEFILPLFYTDSANIDGQAGSGVDINAGWGFGFGFGYNFNDNIQLNGLFTWSSRSYDAKTSTGVRYSNWLDSSTISVNGVFYLLKGDITPFVSAGIGMTWIDTNIPSSPGGAGSCWWDPWWGYVCGSYVPTKTENAVTYSAGLGVRFDVNRQFSIQPSYNKAYIDVSKTAGTPDFDIWRLDFIFRM